MSELLTVLRQIAINNCKKDITADWLAEDASGTAFFSYIANFDCLWGIGVKGGGLKDIADKLCAKKGELTVVIVWDKIPSGNTGAVNTSRYLTPIDWAVALSLKIGKTAEKNKTELPDVRVLILDLGSRMVPGAESMQVLSYVHSEMPWIKLFRQKGKGDSWYKAFVDEIIAEPIQIPFMLSVKNSRNIVERLWQTALTKTSKLDDHHALANLVGPMLLLPSMQSSFVEVRALQELLKALSIFTEESPQKLSKHSKERWGALSRRLVEKNAKILLLDDQWRDGWGAAISGLLGAQVPFISSDKKKDDRFVPLGEQVKAASNPEFLLKIIRKALPGRKFQLQLDTHDSDRRDEILLLDLRLYQGCNDVQEIDFFLDLVEIARDQNTNEKWKFFDELDDVKRWAEKSKANFKNGSVPQYQNTQEYFCALSLLPRIISNLDPSYPIIVFSSTGRREVTTWFSGYENIIVSFEKPRLRDSYVLVDPSEIGRSLRNAFHRALDFVEAKSLIYRLDSYKHVYAQNEEFSGKHIHVEMYMDEHHPDGYVDSDIKRNNIWLGGCYALFFGNDHNAALNKADDFDDELVKEGYKFFSRENFGPFNAHHALAKNKPAIEILKKVIIYSGGNPFIEPFRVKFNASTSSILDINGDYAYKAAVRVVLEYFIFIVLPSLDRRYHPSGISFSIFAGTRSAPYFDAGKAYHISYSTGIPVSPHKDYPGQFMLRTVDRNTISGIVIEMLENRTCTYSLERISSPSIIYDNYNGITHGAKDGYLYCRSCKAVFQDTGYSTKRTPSQIRWSCKIDCPVCKRDDNLRPDVRGGLYIADHLADAKTFTLGLYSDFLKVLDLGYDEELHDDIKNMLHAVALFDSGDFVSGVLQASAVINNIVVASGNFSNIVLRCLESIATDIIKINFHDFNMIVRHLSRAHEFTQDKERHLGRDQITVLRIDQGCVFCKDSQGNQVIIQPSVSSTLKNKGLLLRDGMSVLADLTMRGSDIFAANILIDEYIETPVPSEEPTTNKLKIPENFQIGQMLNSYPRKRR